MDCCLYEGNNAKVSPKKRTHAHVSVTSVVLKRIRPQIQSNQGHVRRIHSLKSEPSVVTFEIGIFDQVLDRLNNLHKTPDQIRFDDVIYNDIHEQGHDCSVLYVNDNERTNEQSHAPFSKDFLVANVLQTW